MLNKFDDFVSHLCDFLDGFFVVVFILIPVLIIWFFDELVHMAGAKMFKQYDKIEESFVRQFYSFVFITITMVLLFLADIFIFKGLIVFIFKIFCALACTVLVKISNLFFGFLGLDTFGRLAADFFFAVYL